MCKMGMLQSHEIVEESDDIFSTGFILTSIHVEVQNTIDASYLICFLLRAHTKGSDFVIHVHLTFSMSYSHFSTS